MCIRDRSYIDNVSESQHIARTMMKYHLYDHNQIHQGRFDSVYELRKFLCDRKYDISCDADMSCTFDYIKHIKWHFEIEE